MAKEEKTIKTEKKPLTAEEEEALKKLVGSYIVRHYSNDDIEVADAHEEGTTEYSNEGIYKDIVSTTVRIIEKTLSNIVEAAAYRGTIAGWNQILRTMNEQEQKTSEEKK